MKYFKFFWPYLKRYKTYFVISVIASAIYVSTTVFLAYLVKPIFSEVLLVNDSNRIDFFAESKFFYLDLEYILRLFYMYLKSILGIEGDAVVYFVPLLFVVIFVLRSITGFISGFTLQFVGLSTVNDVRNVVYDFVINQDEYFFDKRSQGEILGRLINDVNVLQSIVTSRVADIIEQPLILIGLLWLLFSTDWHLALFSLLVIPALGTLLAFFGKKVKENSKLSQEKVGDFTQIASVALRARRIVKSYNAKEYEIRKFKKFSSQYLSHLLRQQLFTLLSSPVIESAAALAVASLFVYSGIRIREGSLSPSELIAFLSILLLMYDPIRKLNKIYMNIQTSFAAIDRISAFTTQSSNIEKEGEVEIKDFTQQISFENVSFKLGEKNILNGVSFEIKKGEKIAFVGPSGGGKSSIIALLMKFYLPNEGVIKIDNVPLNIIKTSSWRSFIAYIPQASYLLSDNIFENVAYATDKLDVERMRNALRNAFVDLDRIGFKKSLKDDHSISGGEGQRIAIARAFYRDAEIFVFDEATSQLDLKTEEMIIDKIKTLLKDKTVIFVAHRIKSIDWVDRIIVVKNGTVQEIGSPSELISKRGLYYELYSKAVAASSENVEKR